MCRKERLVPTRLKELKLDTVLQKAFTETYYEMSSLVSAFLSDEEREDAIKFINSYIDTAKKTFTKAKIVVSVETAFISSYYRESFRSLSKTKSQNIVNTHAVFSMAFDLAAILYLRRNITRGLLDMSTLSIVTRRDSLLDWWGDSDITSDDFDVHSKAMMANIRGDGQSLASRIGSDNMLIGLVLPQMDSRLTKDHREIFDAIIAGNVANFNALMDS